MIFPEIQAYNVEDSVDWYEHFLDFKCTFKSSIKNPNSAIIEKSNIKIFIKQTTSEIISKTTVIIQTNDIDSAYSYAQDKGVIITSPVSKGSYGNKQFSVKDYDHNEIIYLQSA